MAVSSVRSAPNQYYLKTGTSFLVKFTRILYNITSKEVALSVEQRHSLELYADMLYQMA